MNNSSKTKHYSQSTITFFVVLIMVVMPFAMDEYAASLPHMSRAFHVSAGAMQLSLTIFIFVLAFSQIIFGTLSEHLGRRKVLLGTLGIFLFGTLVCIFSKDYAFLMLGRMLQGVGCGLANILPPILIGEAVDEPHVPKVTSYYMLGYSLIPIIGPVLGGYLQEYFGWEANFIFLFIVGAVVLTLSWMKLPETHFPSGEEKFSLGTMFKNFWHVLKNLTFTGATLSSLFLWAPVVVFSVVAPFLLQNTLKLSASSYGHMALLVGIGFFIGNMLNTLAVKKGVSSKLTIRLGFGFWFLMALVQIGLMSFLPLSVMIVVLPTFLMMVGISFAFPSVYGIALTATDMPGVAGTLINTVVLLAVSAVTAIISRLNIHPGTLYAFLFLVMCVLAIAFYWVSVTAMKRRHEDGGV